MISSSRIFSLFVILLLLINTANCDELPTLQISASGDELFTAAVAESSWRTISEDTLYFSGFIDQSSLNGFRKLDVNRVRNLIINSGGGDARAAIDLAKMLEGHQFRITVTGYCLSACANFLLFSGESVVFKDGVIGFHGNLPTCVSVAGGLHNLAVAVANYSGIPEKATAVEAEFKVQLIRENEFYSALNVKSIFLPESCLPGKGIIDGQTYSFLAPSAEILRSLGINVISGEQSKSRINEFVQHGQQPILRAQ